MSTYCIELSLDQLDDALAVFTTEFRRCTQERDNNAARAGRLQTAGAAAAAAQAGDRATFWQSEMDRIDALVQTFPRFAVRAWATITGRSDVEVPA